MKKKKAKQVRRALGFEKYWEQQQKHITNMKTLKLYKNTDSIPSNWYKLTYNHELKKMSPARLWALMQKVVYGEIERRPSMNCYDFVKGLSKCQTYLRESSVRALFQCLPRKHQPFVTKQEFIEYTCNSNHVAPNTIYYALKLKELLTIMEDKLKTEEKKILSAKQTLHSNYLALKKRERIEEEIRKDMETLQQKQRELEIEIEQNRSKREEKDAGKKKMVTSIDVDENEQPKNDNLATSTIIYDQTAKDVYNELDEKPKQQTQENDIQKVFSQSSFSFNSHFQMSIKYIDNNNNNFEEKEEKSNETLSKERSTEIISSELNDLKNKYMQAQILASATQEQLSETKIQLEESRNELNDIKTKYEQLQRSQLTASNHMTIVTNELNNLKNTYDKSQILASTTQKQLNEIKKKYEQLQITGSKAASKEKEWKLRQQKYENEIQNLKQNEQKYKKAWNKQEQGLNEQIGDLRTHKTRLKHMVKQHEQKIKEMDTNAKKREEIIDHKNSIIDQKDQQI
eukprot:111436_1